jgi:hypothetical protein
MKRQAVNVIVERNESIVDRLLAQEPSDQKHEGRRGCCVGECADAKHPSIAGRIRVLLKDTDGRSEELWIPCLHRLAVRKGDRVLVEHPANWPEPIVVGVIDGFAMRPTTPLLPGPTVTLKSDESVRIETNDGHDLIEVYQGENGPVVRLLKEDVSLEVEGRFSINAHSVDLGARKGHVRITAQDDVEVEGRKIKLN